MEADQHYDVPADLMRMPRRGHILIVDDQPGNLQLIARQLSRHGYEVYLAENWRQAVNALQKVPVDLVLLDINLPDTNGIDACRELKASPKTFHLPVIFLSARAGSEDVIEGFRAGALDYITKPFNTDELLARVDTHLELKLVREQLQETNRKLERSNAQKARMISLIAHDLRNPFQHLRMFPEYVLENRDSLDLDLMQEVAENALTEVTRVSSLLEELVEWSMMELDNLDVNLHSVPVCSLCCEVVADGADAAREKHIDIKCLCDGDVSVMADEKVVKTVLRNLVSNAVKFTPPQGRVAITTQVIAEKLVRVAVEDTGIGIDQRIMQKLFQLGQRVSREGTDKEKGHGFGLYLCDQLLQRLGSRILVCSTPGVSSTFFFYLPLAVKPEARSPQIAIAR